MKHFKTICLLAILVGIQSTSIAQKNCACPSNLVVKATAGQEGAVVNFSAFSAAAECGSYAYTPASGSFFRLGSHSIIVTYANGEKCSFTVTVTDNEAPSLSPITLSRSVLWPASGKMKKVGVYYDASDNGINVKTSLSVRSNGPEGENDSEIVDDHLLKLKASRLADGSPRIYTITVVSTDEAGNKTTRATTIAVSQTMTAVATR